MVIPATIQKESTFQRLLQVAVEVFAEFGFRAATIRQICARANVNVASVHYHFQNKEVLYVKALSFAFEEANKLYPQDAALNRSLQPELRLKLFIENFLKKLMDDGRLGFHSKLISREITEPTKALDQVIETAISPNCALLEEIIREIMGHSLNKAEVHRCVASILGQCLMYKHSRSIIDRLFPDLLANQSAITASTNHITKFSLCALQGLSKKPEQLP
jgi:TetR/AcrR family transcriptional regulator, regulator of cefoperazone and chloramphenicol sensitivity